jgi:hypothetical protein
MKIFLLRISSVAAAVLLCISVYFLTKQTHLADTYTDSAEAALAAEQTLLFVSAKLNEGFFSMDKIKDNLNKTNEILTENFNFNNK